MRDENVEGHLYSASVSGCFSRYGCNEALLLKKRFQPYSIDKGNNLCKAEPEEGYRI